MTGGSTPDAAPWRLRPESWRFAPGLSVWLFIRLLGLVHVIAHASLLVQVRGLIGSRGVWPAAGTMDAVRARGLSWLDFPSLCHLSASDGFLAGLCVAGLVAGLLLVAGFLPWPALLAAGVCHLSLLLVGGPFLSFQWDALLVETTFLALFLQPVSAWRPVRWSRARFHRAGFFLLLALGFKLMFSSGAVKLASGDPAWADGTALLHHYQTQPLPTWTAWHLHQLPPAFHRLSWALMFGIELVLPFLILLPRVFRSAAGLGFALLMLTLMATGNYTFFNLLTLALALLWVDDTAWRALARRFRRGMADSPAPAAGPRWRAVVSGALLLVLGPPHVLQAAGAAGWIAPSGWPAPWRAVAAALQPRACLNSYGLFAVMTTRRPELDLQLSFDGATWQSVEFFHKPGDPARAPGFVAPHQPRLDWQMWFAALAAGQPEPWRQHPWLVNVLQRLLEGEQTVRDLFRHVPGGGLRPLAARCLVRDYRFSTRAERREHGVWWVAGEPGVFIPSVSLPAR